MIHSEQLNELAPALALAQAVIEGADKGNVNPHFKSKYADLASVWDACRKPLTDNGLSVIQALGSEGDAVTCTTMLLHKSGQFIKTMFSMTPQQKTPQAAGSCATYLRRYSLQALVGVAPEDDDGNAASSPKSQPLTTVGAGNDTTDSKTSMVGRSVDKTPGDKADNSAAVATFSIENEQHAKALRKIMSDKGHLRMFNQMAVAMNGKPFTKSSIATEWSKIDPESPDKEPEL